MAQMWKKTMSFLGLVEEYDDDYVDVAGEQQPPARKEAPASRAEPSNVRRIAPAPVRVKERTPVGVSAPAPGGPAPEGARQATSQTVHVTNPTTFNEIEEVGERFRAGIPVIMNLAGSSEAVAKRLLDFASGLIYGLDGRIERVGDRVFLLTPVGTEVSTEERRRLSERGFFNQA